MGFAVSLVAGIAAAVVVNTLNQRVWTYHELERALEAPVLVEIPAMNTPADARLALRRRLAHALLFVICAGTYLGGIYYLYRRQSAAAARAGSADRNNRRKSCNVVMTNEPDLLERIHHIHEDQATGLLELERENEKIAVYFREGLY